MKHPLASLGVIPALVFCSATFGSYPPDIGHYRGLVFSGPAHRASFHLKGGRLANCAKQASSASDLHTCDIEEGALEVVTPRSPDLHIALQKVEVLRSAPTLRYRVAATTELAIGSRTVTVPVSLILTIEDGAPDRVRGFLDFPEQSTRSSLEGYLEP